MREVTITVRCDMCTDPIEEETEGASSVTFTTRGEEYETDVCDGCLARTFLQEARPVKGKRKLKDYVCGCGKSFDTPRGLKQHETKTHK